MHRNHRNFEFPRIFERFLFDDSLQRFPPGDEWQRMLDVIYMAPGLDAIVEIYALEDRGEIDQGQADYIHGLIFERPMSFLERIQAEIRAAAEQRDAAERTFCESWIASRPERASAGELLDLAERAGLPITGKTARARQTSLGRWLASCSESPIKAEATTYHIEKAGSLDGYRLWKIEARPKCT